MTVQTTEPDRAATAWSDEAEIDLRQYIEVLIRWRREIALITLGAVVLAVAALLTLQWMSAPMYQASAEVAIVRTVSDVQFDERFTTTPQEATTSNNDARRLALVVLANSPAIAQEVITQLGDQLTGSQRSVDKLLKMVEASIATPEGASSSNSDLIRIAVTTDTSEQAAAIANAWAAVFVQRANTVYGQVPDELFNSVKIELTKANDDYNARQANLEQFVAKSQSDELNRKILEQQALIDAYSAAGTANRLVVFSEEQEGRRNAIQKYLNALSDTESVLFAQQSQQDLDLLESYHSLWITTTHSLQDAKTLRAHIEQGGDAAARSSALALQILKIDAFGGQLPESIQLSLSTPGVVTAPEMLQDIDGLIAALDARLTDLERQIDQVSVALLSGDNYQGLGRSIPMSSTLAQVAQNELPTLFTLGAFTKESEQQAVNEATANSSQDSFAQKLAAMQAELRSLKAHLEAENALQQQLIQQRDLAWETLKTLSNKVAELNLTRAATNSEVRFAAAAVSPTIPVAGPSPIMASAVAAVVGLVLAVFVAFVANYMGQPPFFTRMRRARSLTAKFY